MSAPFKKIGHCIYCDSIQPPLTREHVLARGLGGNRAPNRGSEAMVLVEASCEICRNITRSFEDDCLNGMFGPVRARLGLNRKDRAKPDRNVQVVYTDGQKEDRRIGVEYLPGAMMIPSFPTAAALMGLSWKPKDVTVSQIVISDDKRVRDPNIHQMSVLVHLNIIFFARLLTKIALGVAYYRFGSDFFYQLGRDFIRLGTGHPNHYVGGFGDETSDISVIDQLHNISLWQYNGFLVVTIQLFAFEGSPVNYVVIGRIKSARQDLPVLSLGTTPFRNISGTDRSLQTGGQSKIDWTEIPS